jgi:hypothetical protein
MQYRGFSIRMTREGVWLAVLPTDATWYDGFQCPDRFALKAAIDNYRDNQRANPWDLPLAGRQAIAA